jgi:putative transposase
MISSLRARMVSHQKEYPWSSFKANAMGEPDGLISPHECWLALGQSDCLRRQAYRALFEKPLSAQSIDDIRYAVSKGLPTGSSKFKRHIERALSIRLGDGKRSRPAKKNEAVE